MALDVPLLLTATYNNELALMFVYLYLKTLTVIVIVSLH